MLIDPFTVGAQIVNFLILIWLLRKVLYGPVTQAMDARDSRIRRDVEDARRLQAEAAAAREQLDRQVATFAAERDARLAEARAEIEAWRRTQMDAARAEMAATRERWQRAFAQEQRAALGKVQRRIVHEVLSLVRATLHDLADTELEERMLARFLVRLRDATPEERERLRAAAADDRHRVHLRTSTPLSDADRTRVHAAICEALGEQVDLNVETTAEPGYGVELRAGELKVAWSLHEHVRSLEDRLASTFDETAELANERA